MLRCSKEAFARCPTAHLCGQREDSTFVEGSECDKFNQAMKHGRGSKTNADFIRELFSTDEGMAKTLRGLDIMLAEDGKEFTALYCNGKNNCADGDGEIICNEEMQTACILRWLRRPAQTKTTVKPMNWSKVSLAVGTDGTLEFFYNGIELPQIPELKERLHDRQSFPLAVLGPDSTIDAYKEYSGLLEG